MKLKNVYKNATASPFVARVQTAIAVVAVEVVAEDPNTPNHEARVVFARGELRTANSDATARNMAWPLALHPNYGQHTAADPSTNDAALLAAVRGLWDGFA